MRTLIVSTGLLLLASLSAQAGEGEGQNPMGKLESILKKMDLVEKLLAKSQIREGEKTQAEIIEELKEEVEKGKLKEDEVLDDVARQLDVIVKKMKDIDQDFVKLIQSVKLSQSKSGGGMDLKNNTSKPSEKEQAEKRKEEKERELKKLREKNQQKKKNGSKKEDGSKGKDPARQANNSREKAPEGSSGPRAEGGDSWGNLPLKEYREALASGRVKFPEKYKALIEKYLEMLAKKASESSD